MFFGVFWRKSSQAFRRAALKGYATPRPRAALKGCATPRPRAALKGCATPRPRAALERAALQVIWQRAL